MTQLFLDTEFSSLLDPQLLSIGLVTLDGREHYAELDLASETGKSRLASTPWDVREGVIADKWERFPESVCDSDSSIGLRVGLWMLEIAGSDAEGRLQVLYDYGVDWELLVGALEESGLWRRIQALTSHRNIAVETGDINAELVSEATYRRLRRRSPPLYRHHALADAIALRAAWQMWCLKSERPADLERLVAVGESGAAWLHEWLALPAMSLDGQVPLDVLARPGGLELVETALGQISRGCA